MCVQAPLHSHLRSFRHRLTGLLVVISRDKSFELYKQARGSGVRQQSEYGVAQTAAITAICEISFRGLNMQPRSDGIHVSTANVCHTQWGNEHCNPAVCISSEQCTKQRRLIIYQVYSTILGAFAKFRKGVISFVMPAHLPVRPSAWNSSVPPGWGFMKFGIIFRKSVEKIQVSLKPHTNSWYFTQRPMHIYDSISLNSS